MLAPAYGALSVAIGAGAYALGRYFLGEEWVPLIHIVALLSMLAAFGSAAGAPVVRRCCDGVRILLAIVLALGMLAVISQAGRWFSDMETACGAFAGMVGVAALWCVLGIGVPLQGRPVPISAPMVGVLSLFGLLHILSVDTPIQISFLIFAAATLFLVAYERMLTRIWQTHESRGEERQTEARVAEQAHSARIAASSALTYFLSSNIWFVVLLLGAVALYYPLEHWLPRMSLGALNRSRDMSQYAYDWRGTSNVMELSGGKHTLSERPTLRVYLFDGNWPGLWRTRILEQYSDSTWQMPQEREQSRTIRARLDEWQDVIQNSPDSFNQKLGHFTPVTEVIETIGLRSANLIASGEVTRARGGWQRLYRFPNGIVSAASTWATNRHYAVQSKVFEPNESRLSDARGLRPDELEQWRQDMSRQSTLQVPYDSDQRKQLAEVATAVVAKAERDNNAMLTPYDKVRAIHNYLLENYYYSLDSPQVPITEDGVLFFLTRSRQGACDMFASATALLLRYMDVPSRLATGYLQPDNINNTPRLSDQLEPELQFEGITPQQTLVLRERDAHAWIEYFVPGAGWITYDPTQGSRTIEEANSAANTNSNNINWQSQGRTLVLPLLGITMLVIGGVWTLVDLNARRRQNAGAGIGNAQSEAIAAIYARALAQTSTYVPYASQMTPQEYEHVVLHSTLHPDAKAEFSALTYLYSHSHYGQTVPHASVDELEISFNRLKVALKQRNDVPVRKEHRQ
jgi:transglutaminase-like putative cysteine protease